MGIVVWIAADVAWAGISPGRERLSARQIERPVVEPKGWAELHGIAAAGEVGTEIRYGLGPSVDLGMAEAWSIVGLDAVRMSVRRSLYEREPRMTSLALDLGWTVPVVGSGDSAPDIGMLLRQELAPFQLELGTTWSQPSDRLTETSAGNLKARGQLMVEGGPLLVTVSVEGDSRGSSRWGWETALQLSRGLTIGGGAAYADQTGQAHALLGIWF